MTIKIIDDYINQNEHEWNDSKYKRYIDLEFYVLNTNISEINYRTEYLYEKRKSKYIHYDLELHISFEEYVYNIKDYSECTYKLNTPYKDRQLYFDVINKIINYEQLIKKAEDECDRERLEKKKQLEPIKNKLSDDELKILRQFIDI